MGLHQTKKLLHSKGNHQKMKTHPTEMGDISDKGLIPKIYEELIKLNTQKNEIIQLKMGTQPE